MASRTLVLRPVGDDGAVGEPMGSARLDGREIVYTGSEIIAEVIAAGAQRFRLDEPAMFARLAEHGWSNGKLVIAGETAAGQEESA